jgi:hypothetical protein
MVSSIEGLNFSKLPKYPDRERPSLYIRLTEKMSALTEARLFVSTFLSIIVSPKTVTLRIASNIGQFKIDAPRHPNHLVLSLFGDSLKQICQA